MTTPILAADFFERPVTTVARDLLGRLLVSSVGRRTASGRIVETEAYGGAEDLASHACTRAGVTRRNRAMFGPPGRVYVYRSYGMHWCLNLVTGAAGVPGAVLIRGIEPVDGEDVMRDRRGGRTPLGAGPGRLAEALGVTDALYGHDLAGPPLMLAPGRPVEDVLVEVSGRVGVARAADRPYRFYIRGATGVSRPDGWDSGGGFRYT